MVAPVIPALDPDKIPQRDGSQVQGVYSDNMDYFASELPNVITGMNTSTSFVNDTATDAENSAIDSANSATASANSATASANSATAAAASAASAASSPSTSATSTTSLTPGLGSKSLSLVETGKNFVVGQWVVISDSTTPTTKFLRGAITAFNSGTGAMTVNVTDFAGSTSGTNWVVSLSSPPNIAGIFLPPTTVTGTSVTMVAWGVYLMANTGAVSTATFPVSPNPGERIRVSFFFTGRYDGVLARNGKPIMAINEDMTIVNLVMFEFLFVDNTYGWVFA